MSASEEEWGLADTLGSFISMELEEDVHDLVRYLFLDGVQGYALDILGEVYDILIGYSPVQCLDGNSVVDNWKSQDLPVKFSAYFSSAIAKALTSVKERFFS